MPGFEFVMNIRSLAEATYNLAPGNVLRRATNEEVATIKEKLQTHNVEGFPGLNGQTWEKRLFLPPGPVEEWRYFVIAFEDGNQELVNLELASCLASFEIEGGFTIFNDGGIGWHPDRLFHTVAALRANDQLFCSVSADDVQEIISINSQLQSCDSQTKELVLRLQGLKGLPHGCGSPKLHTTRISFFVTMLQAFQ